jgi:hypothetical protein
VVLYQHKNFDAIEKHISDLLSQEANEAKAHELYVLYRSLTRVTKDSDAERMKNVLHEWCNKHPKSHIPWLVRGAFYISYAYPRSPAAYTQAQRDLEKSQQLNPYDPNASCFLIEVARLSNFPREKMEQYYNKGVSVCPFHFGLHYNKFAYLTPGWHGSTEEMLKFADECLMLSEQYPYLGLIMIYALEEIHNYNREKKIIWEAMTFGQP